MVQTLVTGGTGFVGSEIVRYLVRGSESVRVLSRSPKKLLRSQRIPGTEFFQGDVFNPPTLEAALAGSDAMINAVQFENAPFENPRRGLTYERVDGEGTERQVEAAKKAGVKRFIYISGAGTREGRREPWFRAKLRAEKAVQESGLQWTIFRPSWIYGPGDRSLNKFAMFARLGPIVPLIGMGKEKIQPLYIMDMAKAVSLALNNSKTFGKILDIGGPESLSMHDIVATLLKVMGKRRIIFPQPKSMMKFIAAFVQFLPGKLRFLTPGGVDFITMEESVDNSALLQLLKLTLTPLEEGLRSYLSGPLPADFSWEEERAI